jgi:membrane protease subunit HflK
VRRTGLLVLIGAALAYAATGLVMVAPGERVVVHRLGRIEPHPWPPGLHLGFPAGIDRTTRVRTDAVRRLDVITEETPGATEFLTGDRNVIRVRAVVQYRVADPSAFVRAGDRVAPLLSRLAGSTLASALAGRSIDAVLHAERSEVARTAASRLADGCDHYGLGLAILGVSLTEARPPAEVEPDFAATQAARSDRERRLREASTMAATTRAAARAEADARITRARANADRTVLLARAHAGRFLALLDEARSERRLTVLRLYRDAIRDLLPHVRRKILLTPDEAVDLSVFGTDEPARP